MAHDSGIIRDKISAKKGFKKHSKVNEAFLVANKIKLLAEELTLSVRVRIDVQACVGHNY